MQLHKIAPEKPTQNGYCESFNDKLRDKYLNDNYFASLQDACKRIEA